MFVLLSRVFNKFFPEAAKYAARRRQARATEYAARHRRTRYIRLHLEGLEERIVPDAYVFATLGAGGGLTPSVGSYTLIANWTDLTPPGGGPPVPATQLPEAGDTADIPTGAVCVLDNSTDEQQLAGLSVEGSMTIKSTLTVLPGGSGTGATTVSSGGFLDVTTPDIPGTTSQLETSTLTTAASGSTTNLSIDENATVEIDSSAFLSGTTSITGLLDAKNIDAFTGATVTLDGPGTIGGTGQMEAGINATITFDPSSTWTILPDGAAGDAFKEGQFFVDGLLAVNSNFDPAGDITLDPGGTIGGTGSLDEWHELTWLGGTLGLAGGTTIEPQAEFKTDGNSNKELASDLTNISSFTELGGNGLLTINSGVTFDNAAGTVALTLPFIITDSSTDPGTFVNDANGTLDGQSPASSPSAIACNFTNLGTIDVANGDNLILDNSSFNWTQDLDGTLNLEGDLTLWGVIGSSLGLVQNAGGGTLMIGDHSGSFGALNLSEGAVFGGNVEVTGVGTLMSDATVYNNGKLTIDLPDPSNSVYLSSYQQTSDGTLVLQAAHPALYSSLAVAGNAQLSGTLEIEFLDGFTPSSGEAFTVVTAGSIGAHFDSVPADMTASYTSTTATVTQN